MGPTVYCVILEISLSTGDSMSGAFGRHCAPSGFPSQQWSSFDTFNEGIRCPQKFCQIMHQQTESDLADPCNYNMKGARGKYTIYTYEDKLQLERIHADMPMRATVLLGKRVDFFLTLHAHLF